MASIKNSERPEYRKATRRRLLIKKKIGVLNDSINILTNADEQLELVLQVVELQNELAIINIRLELIRDKFDIKARDYGISRISANIRKSWIVQIPSLTSRLC